MSAPTLLARYNALQSHLAELLELAGKFPDPEAVHLGGELQEMLRDLAGRTAPITEAQLAEAEASVAQWRTDLTLTARLRGVLPGAVVLGGPE